MISALSWTAIVLLAALDGASVSLPSAAVLIAVLLRQTSQDLADRRYVTPLALTLGSGVSIASKLPGASQLSVLDRVGLIVPLATVHAAFVYATAISYIKLYNASQNSRLAYTTTHAVFPLLWCALWTLFCRLHSLGRLAAWVPFNSMSAFSWLLPAFGPPILDFLIAVLGIALLEVSLGTVANAPAADSPRLVDFDEAGGHNPVLDLQALGDRQAHARKHRRRFAAVVLAILGVVWWTGAIIAAAPVSGEDGDAQPVKIACVLPYTPSQGSPTLQDYLTESEIVSGRGAKVLQWPEAAAHFDTKAEQERTLLQLSSLSVRRKAYFGTSYTAPVLVHDGDQRPSIVNTLVSPYASPVYNYTKQALVPVVESYRYLAGEEELPRKIIFVPDSNQGGHSQAKGQNLTVSTAICHDTSFDCILGQANSASLLLVPSSVYSTKVAWSRISHLATNARALSTAVLVCEGSSKGISAFITSTGQLRYWQQGPGSFELSARLPQLGGTAYGRYGTSGSLGTLAAVCVACGILELLVRSLATQARGWAREAWTAARRRFEEPFSFPARRRGSQSDLLA